MGLDQVQPNRKVQKILLGLCSGSNLLVFIFLLKTNFLPFSKKKKKKKWVSEFISFQHSVLKENERAFSQISLYKDREALIYPAWHLTSHWPVNLQCWGQKDQSCHQDSKYEKTLLDR